MQRGRHEGAGLEPDAEDASRREPSPISTLRRKTTSLLHLLLNDGRAGSSRRLAKMRPGALFVNTARGRSSIRPRWSRAVRQAWRRRAVCSSRAAGGTDRGAATVRDLAFRLPRRKRRIICWRLHYVPADPARARGFCVRATATLRTTLQHFASFAARPCVAHAAQISLLAPWRWSCCWWCRHCFSALCRNSCCG